MSPAARQHLPGLIQGPRGQARPAGSEGDRCSQRGLGSSVWGCREGGAWAPMTQQPSGETLPLPFGWPLQGRRASLFRGEA